MRTKEREESVKVRGKGDKERGNVENLEDYSKKKLKRTKKT